MVSTKLPRRSFSDLLHWHLINGTRPTGEQQREWTNADFAAAVKLGLNEKSVRNWRRGVVLPRLIDHIERALFGDAVTAPYSQGRDELRSAYKAALSKDDQGRFVAESQTPEPHPEEMDSVGQLDAPPKNEYDWGTSVVLSELVSLQPGARILYEEHSLDPEFDRRIYARNQQIRIPTRPFATSPRGFVKLDEDDYEWIDPRNRNRRICEGIISKVMEDGRVKLSGTPLVLTDIVDILLPTRTASEGN